MAHHKLDISLPIEMEHRVAGTAAARLVVPGGATYFVPPRGQQSPSDARRKKPYKRKVYHSQITADIPHPIRNFLIFSR
jgi:hypothetical protein